MSSPSAFVSALKQLSKTDLAHVLGGAGAGGAAFGYTAHRQKKRLKTFGAKDEGVSIPKSVLVGSILGGAAGLGAGGPDRFLSKALKNPSALQDRIKDITGKAHSHIPARAAGTAIGAALGGLSAHSAAKKQKPSKKY